MNIVNFVLKNNYLLNNSNKKSRMIAEFKNHI